MTAADPIVSAATPPSTLPTEPTRWTLWSDRLNPILVREVLQSVKGRVFALTVFVALLVSVVIAVVTVNAYEPRGDAGRMAFNAGIATLMPLLIFVVPMQAYQSMRLELRGGIVEQLLLSRLVPRRILWGKLQAALVQFVLYVAVLAPLLATSYLLRGVDLPTILVSLLFALCACVAATAFAVSSAAQGVLPAMQPLANLATAAGLGLASFAFVGFAGSGAYTYSVGWLVRSNECTLTIVGIALATAAAVVLSLLVAQSFLLHAFENKSTGFRVFLFALPVVAFGWVLAFMPRSSHDEFLAVFGMSLLVVGIVFGQFMVTEQRELSPRLRAHVPKSRLASLVAAPFLPGRDRGMACLVLYLAWLGGLVAVLWPGTSSRWIGELLRSAGLCVPYAIVYLGLGRWLRGFLPSSVAGNHVARVLLPLAVVVFMILPALVDLMLRGDVRGWHVGHVMNPFWTIDVHNRAEAWSSVLPWAIGVSIGGLLLQVPAMVRGQAEVAAAAAVRRERARTA
ncbi:MAG: hypothetical protein JNK15_18540 [Planctomycetes bacterium]|nr:hypothetical protein [Planctomycetota bacterium]